MNVRMRNEAQGKRSPRRALTLNRTLRLEESEQPEQDQEQNDGHNQPDDAIRSAHPCVLFGVRAGLTCVGSSTSVRSSHSEHHRPTG